MNVTTAETNTNDNTYFEKRYEAMVDLEKATGLINMVLQQGFNCNELTKEEAYSIATQVREIGACLYGARDYVTKVHDLLENG